MLVCGDSINGRSSTKPLLCPHAGDCWLCSHNLTSENFNAIKCINDSSQSNHNRNSSRAKLLTTASCLCGALPGGSNSCTATMPINNIPTYLCSMPISRFPAVLSQRCPEHAAQQWKVHFACTLRSMWTVYACCAASHVTFSLHTQLAGSALSTLC